MWHRLASRHKLGKGAEPMKARAYTWRVLVNVFYLTIVFFVFEVLSQRDDKIALIVVAVLGVIYVAVRGSTTYQALLLWQVAKQGEEHPIQIRRLIGDKEDANLLENRVKTDKQTSAMARTKAYIDFAFLSIIGLFCLFVLSLELQLLD
jgi:hypothetical protein